MNKLFLLLASFFSLTASAQYYYKDVIGTRETADILSNYRINKIKKVTLNSYDANNTRNNDLKVEQSFDQNTLRTTTQSGDGDAGLLLTYLNEKGLVIKTVDSSVSLRSTTAYYYDNDGNLNLVKTSSSDSSGAFVMNEEHRWEYVNGKPSRMVRIKNLSDSSIVNFKLDEKGNVAEEQSIRRGVKSEPVYYYYDAQNRLTDIVRYNNKVRRLLPEYMFEYSAKNQVIQKITVPGNSSNYLIWRYQYGTDGLKTKEAIYNKQKQLTGKIEYAYQRG